MKTAIIPIVFLVAVFVSSNTVFGAGHTVACMQGYRAGLNNDTITTGCIINRSM
ncbi:MAG: hypothetical protein WAM14_06005 [Candidatus Nitrosopolaris sp.]